MAAELTNSDRAASALRALVAYDGPSAPVCCGVGSRLRGVAPDDSRRVPYEGAGEEALSDVLCDLRHLADRMGVDFAACDRRAYRAYSDEASGVDGIEAGPWPLAVVEVSDEEAAQLLVEAACVACSERFGQVVSWKAIDSDAQATTVRCWIEGGTVEVSVRAFGPTHAVEFGEVVPDGA